MKRFSAITILLLIVNFGYTQKTNSFKKIEKRVSSTFFNTPEKAKKDAILLKKLAKTKYEKQIAYKFLGYVYDLTGEVDSARFYLNKRLNFTKKHFKKKLPYYESVISYTNWGVNYVGSDVLIEELTKALNTIKIDEFHQQKGLIYLLMGDILLRENDLDNANIYFDKSFKLIKGKYAPIDYYLRKGKVSILNNEYKKAKTYLNKGLNINGAKTTYTYPHFLNMLGYISIINKDLTLAHKHLKESLKYQEKNNFKTFRANTYLYLALLAREENSNKEITFLNQALKHSKKDPVVTKDIYLALKGYYERKKILDKEQYYLKKFTNLNDSIFNLEKAKIKLDLEWRYKLSESEKEIKFQNKIISDDKEIKKLYSLALVLLFLLIITIVIVFKIRLSAQNKNYKIQKLLHDEQLKSTLEIQKTEIIKEKIKAQSKERERLSLELHDGIASEISALKLSLSSSENITNPTIQSTVSKIDELYNEVRNLSHNLSPNNITEIEFVQLIHKIAEIPENNGIHISKNIVISKNIDSLDEKKLISIYRILQEIINNLIKHSKATKATIEILETESNIILEVSDNGIGIKDDYRTGIGLKNIKQRVNNLKGKINILSKKGTKISIVIPLK